MKKKWYQAFIVIAVLFIGFISAWSVRSEHTRLKACPDEWYEDRMPSPMRNGPGDQYFVINGERKEIKDYDLAWIQKNCSVKMQYVY